MIYVLDNDPKPCAQYLDDRSLDKMIKDIAQVLCNIHWYIYDVAGYGIPLKPSKGYFNDKWVLWTRECKANYLYLVDLLDALLFEYTHRFEDEKAYKFYNRYCLILLWTRDNVPDLPRYFGLPLDIDTDNHNGSITPFPLVMPKKYLQKTLRFPWTENHTVESYRNYYQAKLQQSKFILFKWSTRRKPEWVKI